jgi:hypothetical protein
LRFLLLFDVFWMTFAVGFDANFSWTEGTLSSSIQSIFLSLVVSAILAADPTLQLSSSSDISVAGSVAFSTVGLLGTLPPDLTLFWLYLVCGTDGEDDADEKLDEAGKLLLCFSKLT